MGFKFNPLTGNFDLDASASPGGSSGEIQFNASGTFDGDPYLNWNDILKFLGVQNTSPEGPLHVTGVSGQTVAAPASASAVATLEALVDSPTTYSITQIDGPTVATTVSTAIGGYIDTPPNFTSISEVSDGSSAMLAQGQTWTYRIYGYKDVGALRICNGAIVTQDLTDTINDNNPVRVDLSWTAPGSADYDGYILVRTDNIATPLASIVLGSGLTSYSDYGFTDNDSFVVSTYQANGTTYTQQAAQYKTIGGTPYIAAPVVTAGATDDSSGKYLWLVLTYDTVVNDGFQVITYNGYSYENGTATTFVDYGQTDGAISPYTTFASVGFEHFNTSITGPASVDENFNYGSGSLFADSSSWEVKVWPYRTGLDGVKYFASSPSAASGANSDDNSSNVFNLTGTYSLGDETGNYIVLYQNGNMIIAFDNSTSTSYSISGGEGLASLTPDISSYTGTARSFRAYGVQTSPSTKYSGTYNSQSFTDNNPVTGYVIEHTVSGLGNATAIKINQQSPTFVHMNALSGAGSGIQTTGTVDGDTTVSPGTIGYLGNGDSYNYTVFATKTINGSAVWSATGAAASVTLPNDSNHYTISLSNASVSGATYKAKRKINSGSFVYQTYSSSPLSDTTLTAWNSNSTLTPTSSLVPGIIVERAATSYADPSAVIVRNNSSNQIQSFIEFQANQSGTYTQTAKFGTKSDGTLSITNTAAVGSGNIDIGSNSAPYIRLNSAGNFFNLQNGSSSPTTFYGNGVTLGKFQSNDNTFYVGNPSLNYDPTAAMAVQANGTSDYGLLVYAVPGAGNTQPTLILKNSSAVTLFLVDTLGHVGVATSSTGNGNLNIGPASSSGVQIQFQSNSNLSSGVSRGLSTQGTDLYWSGAGSAWRKVNTGLSSSTSTFFWRSDANGDPTADNALQTISGVIVAANLLFEAKQGISLDAGKDLSMAGSGSILGPIRFENQNKTANFTLGSQHTYTVTSGTVDATLPTAASIAGREYEIINIGTGVVTIKNTSGQTTGGLASGAIQLRQYQSIKVISDGSNYQIGALTPTVGNLFCQTATGTIANSTTETTISSTGVGSLTLPANFLVAGKTIRVRGQGIHSAVSNPNITVKVKFGSTVVCSTGAIGSKNSTNEGFEIDVNITCRTTGASGTVFGQGTYTEMGVADFGMTNTATTTIDTTASQAITVTAQWDTASASNTISLTNLTVEALS